jgi:hypothetical protein
MGRKHVVEKFAAWTYKYPARAKDRLDARDLAPEKPRDPQTGIHVARKTLGKYFPHAQCGGSTWHALCYMAVFVYELYGPPESSPRFIRACATTYANWLNEDQALTSPVPIDVTDARFKSNEELLAVIHGSDDLLAATEAACVLTGRLHRKLSTSTLFESKARSREQALNAAHKIVSIAGPVIHRVHAVRDQVGDEVKINCVAIVDAAVDAHRLRSRDPAREGHEFGLLLDLRNMDLDITGDVRPKPDVALNTYYRDMARAYLSHSPSQTVDAEIAAAERLLRALTDMGAKVVSDDASHPSDERHPHSMEPDKLVNVITQIAASLVAHPDDASLRERAAKCVKQLLKLYSPPAGLDRRDAATLLRAAQGGTLTCCFTPLEALRIVKFRGVGELLVARFLVHIATADTHVEITSHATLYLGEPVDNERRKLALQRAIGLYERGTAWLRNLGAAGALRRLVEDEYLSAMQALREHSHHKPPDDDNQTLENIRLKMADLRKNIDDMIVDGILWPELNTWTDIKDRQAVFAAAEINAALQQIWRYLRQPELGLRTDLPPLAEIPDG